MSSNSRMTAVKMFINDHLSQEFQATYIENDDDSTIEIKIKNLDASLAVLAFKHQGIKFSFAPDLEKEKLSVSIESIRPLDHETTSVKIKFYFE